MAFLPFFLVLSAVAGSYNLTFSTLDYMGNYQEELTVTIGSQFINYLWATPDLTKQLYYVVMGDENSARDLKASILTYNITKKYEDFRHFSTDYSEEKSKCGGGGGEGSGGDVGD